MTKQPPDIVDWAESEAGFYLAETRRPIILANHQKDILRHLFTQDSAGKLPYETIVYSCPKKSGKTTIAAVVALWFSLFIEAPNEIFVLANSLEQSVGRSFKDLAGAIRLNRILAKRTNARVKEFSFDNGTTVTALSSDYAGAAGSRHGLTIWDELWAYSTENARRLWDELTPVPTKRNSIRLVVTYAGFEGESLLLEELYKRGQGGTPVPELVHIENGRGEPACRANNRTFVYWDHELKHHPGLTITSDDYHEQQRLDLRPGAFARLHLNEWASSIDRFVTPDQWAACFHSGVKPLLPSDTRRAFFGADASVSRDFTALVGVLFDGNSQTHQAVYCRIWKPRSKLAQQDHPVIDLSDTIASEILRLHQRHQVAAVIYDPYQLHSIAVDLEKLGVRMIELPQTARRIESDQALYDAIVGRNIHHFNHEELNEHINNAIAIETARGFRLAKEKANKKIDAAVALSMALHGSSNQRQSNFGSWLNQQADKRQNRDFDLTSLVNRADEAFWREQWLLTD